MPLPATKGAAIVHVEPTLCRILLADMHENRPIKERNKAKIMAAFLGAYWVTNGEPLILSEEMRLLDGRNRLESSIETNTPFATLMTWGWPQAAFVTIDTGIKRSGGDTLTAAGETNAYAMSAAARYDWRLQTGNMPTEHNLPDALIATYVQQHPGLKASMSWGDLGGRLIPKGLAVALHYRLSLQNPSLAKQFFQEIARGENINSKHTTYWLRELLGGYRHGNLHLGRIQQAHIAANILKGWHAVCAGRLRQRHQLLWHPERDEPFPEVVYAAQ